MSFVREQDGSPEEPGAEPRGQGRHRQEEDPDTEVAPRVEGVEGPRTYAELFNQIFGSAEEESSSSSRSWPSEEEQSLPE